MPIPATLENTPHNYSVADGTTFQGSTGCDMTRALDDHQNISTHLRPIMARMVDLVENQTEMIRIQRETMGVVLSLILRVDTIAASQSQSPDKPSESDLITHGKQSEKHQCHCNMIETLEESTLRRIAETKTEILTSIGSLSDKVTICCRNMDKFLDVVQGTSGFPDHPLFTSTPSISSTAIVSPSRSLLENQTEVQNSTENVAPQK